MRTGAIKIFKSVGSSGDKGSALRQYFGSSDPEGSLGGCTFGGGVVVFSTQHSSNGDGSNEGGVGWLSRSPCCPVACMGGDYDGDMYVPYHSPYLYDTFTS